MKDSFTTLYQTLLSIVQGVALADLAVFVETKYEQFTIGPFVRNCSRLLTKERRNGTLPESPL